MVYLYDDETKKRVELEEITGIDKACNIIFLMLEGMCERETIKKIEAGIEKKTGRKCVVLPKGIKVLGIK